MIWPKKSPHFREKNIGLSYLKAGPEGSLCSMLNRKRPTNNYSSLGRVTLHVLLRLKFSDEKRFHNQFGKRSEAEEHMKSSRAGQISKPD